MRPCTELKPWEPLTKYDVVFEEQPMPDSFTSCSGRKSRPQQASMMAAVTESCPQPAQSVDMVPSYCRRVIPSALVGRDGWATLGLLMNDMISLQRVCLPVIAVSRGASGRVARTPSTMGSHDIGK